MRKPATFATTPGQENKAKQSQNEPNPSNGVPDRKKVLKGETTSKVVDKKPAR
jgi:hypothetical protein